MLALWMAWTFFRLRLRAFEGKASNTGGSFFRDDLQALDDSGHHFVFQAGVEAFGILANDDEGHVRIASRNVRQILDGAEVGVQVELLTQLDIDAGESTPTGVVTGPFNATRVRSMDSVSDGERARYTGGVAVDRLRVQVPIHRSSSLTSSHNADLRRLCSTCSFSSFLLIRHQRKAHRLRCRKCS